MMTDQKKHSEMLGKTKAEISKIWTNNVFNYYQANVWTYKLKSNWLGTKTFLIICFENDIVIHTEIRKSF